MIVIDKILANPRYYTSILISLMRGTFYIIYYAVFKKNIRIKFPFLVSARVSISGPGSVEIGSRCVVVENVFKGLTIITSSETSHVKIGNRCMLAGLTIRCTSDVTIGDHVMTAVSLMQDTMFVNGNRALEINPAFTQEASAITLGNNVWIGGHCTLLAGCNIGDHSVMSAYSVCGNENIKVFSLINGNPVRKALPIEQLLKLRNIS